MHHIDDQVYYEGLSHNRNFWDNVRQFAVSAKFETIDVTSEPGANVLSTHELQVIYIFIYT